MPIPEFTTDRLILRPLRIGDAADMFVYAKDDLVARPGMWEPYSSFQDCTRHVEQLVGLYDRDLMWWALEHREDRRLLAGSSFPIGAGEMHAPGYALNRDYWGQGLMTEAVIEPLRTLDLNEPPFREESEQSRSTHR